MVTGDEDQEPLGPGVLLPTGFGVADLEVARERDALLADLTGSDDTPEPLPGEVDVTASGAE